ncbi:hypothetical protein J4479_04320 [Candidatus Woesearchaeota archaeon]|nr:hypothetical protein [Candidatus Woesearchaeota archaeon]
MLPKEKCTGTKKLPLEKKKKKGLIAPAVLAVIPIGIFHNYPLAAAFATPLYFETLHFLEDVLFHDITYFFFEKQFQFSLIK